jgi:aminoglycoside 2'-N-acetyltransferase I
MMQVDLVDGEAGWALVEALDREVYPPEVMATVIWRHIVWAQADKRVVVSDDGRVVCHAGLFFREGTLNRKPAKMCGIGGVMTSPHARRKGFAGAAMTRAAQAMAGADFGLLFCEPHNVALYAGLGWKDFPGRVECDQPSGRMVFDMMPRMVLPLAIHPAGGMIDLCGLPW